MPSFYSWLLRLLLLVALCLLSITLVAAWPDRAFRWIDVVGVLALGLSTLGVAVWTIAVWLGESAVEPAPARAAHPARPLPPASASQA